MPDPTFIRWLLFCGRDACPHTVGSNGREVWARCIVCQREFVPSRRRLSDPIPTYGDGRVPSDKLREMRRVSRTADRAIERIRSGIASYLAGLKNQGGIYDHVVSRPPRALLDQVEHDSYADLRASGGLFQTHDRSEIEQRARAWDEHVQDTLANQPPEPDPDDARDPDYDSRWDGTPYP